MHSSGVYPLPAPLSPLCRGARLERPSTSPVPPQLPALLVRCVGLPVRACAVRWLGSPWQVIDGMQELGGLAESLRGVLTSSSDPLAVASSVGALMTKNLGVRLRLYGG